MSRRARWAELARGHAKRKLGGVDSGGGNNPGVLVGEPAAWLRERINGADFTLRGLQAELAERNVTAAYKAVWRFVHGEKLTFKKKRFARRAGSP